MSVTLMCSVSLPVMSGPLPGWGRVYFRCFAGHFRLQGVHFRVHVVVSHCFPVVEGHFRWNRSHFRCPRRTSGDAGGLPDHRGVLPVSYSMTRKFVSMIRQSSNVAGSPPRPAEAALYGPEVLWASFVIPPPPPVVVLIFGPLCAVVS